MQFLRATADLRFRFAAQRGPMRRGGVRCQTPASALGRRDLKVVKIRCRASLNPESETVAVRLARAGVLRSPLARVALTSTTDGGRYRRINRYFAANGRLMGMTAVT